MFFYPTACIPAPASTQPCVILVPGLLPQGMMLNTLSHLVLELRMHRPISFSHVPSELGTIEAQGQVYFIF
jgi:hypothetical protein